MEQCVPRSGRLFRRTTMASEVIVAGGVPVTGAAPSAAVCDTEGTLPKAAVRIGLLHLDSLCCLPAMNELFDALQDRIVLVISSDRLQDAGGLSREFMRRARTSGLRMTVALGFDIVAIRIAAALTPVMRLFSVVRTPRRSAACRHWRTLRELAVKVGAEYWSFDDINKTDAIECIRTVQPDLLVSFHFDQILRKPLLSAVACPVVNVHPALLPARRGPCPSFWTLAGADGRCGVSIHRILDESIDSGPVLARRARTRPDVSMGELDEMLFLDGARLLADLLREQPRVAIDPAGPAPSPSYETFPPRSEVRAARRRGVRLWRLTHAARLIAGLYGWHLPSSEGRR